MRNIKNTLKESLHRFFYCALSLILGLVILTGCNKGSETAGTFNFKLYDKNSTCVIDDNLEFNPNETVFDVLNREYTLEVQVDGTYTAILSVKKGDIKVEGIWSVDQSYLAFYIDDKYATTGAKDTYLADGMKVALKWESM